MSDAERDKVAQYKTHCTGQCDTICNMIYGTKGHKIFAPGCLLRTGILKAYLRWAIKKFNELRWNICSI